MNGYRIDYEAFIAWSTFAAVVLALGQTMKLAIDQQRQRRYESWLRERGVEERYLRDLMAAVEEPLTSAQRCFLSSKRVLHAMPGTLFGGAFTGGGWFEEIPAEEDRAVRRQAHEEERRLDFELSQVMDVLAIDEERNWRTLTNHVEIVSAFRDLARRRNDEVSIADYEAIIRLTRELQDANDQLVEWISDEDNIIGTSPEDFGKARAVIAVRVATSDVSTAIARKIVKLFESQPER